VDESIARSSGPGRGALTIGLWAAGLFVVVAWCVADDYGPTWDFVFGEYAQGERYLAYFRTFDPVHLDFTNPAGRPTFEVPHLDDSTGSFQAHECHQFPGWMSALGCAVLYRGLGVASCVAAHHAWAVLASAVLVFVLARFATRHVGRMAAVFAIAALLTAPRYFVDALTNIKDGPECALFCITLLTWFAVRERPTLRATFLIGLLNGVALAQKLNACFIPIQLLLIVGLANALRSVRGEPRLPVPWRSIPAYVVAALIGVDRAVADVLARSADEPHLPSALLLERGEPRRRQGPDRRSVRRRRHYADPRVATRSTRHVGLASHRRPLRSGAHRRPVPDRPPRDPRRRELRRRASLPRVLSVPRVGGGIRRSGDRHACDACEPAEAYARRRCTPRRRWRTGRHRDRPHASERGVLVQRIRRRLRRRPTTQDRRRERLLGELLLAGDRLAERTREPEGMGAHVGRSACDASRRATQAPTRSPPSSIATKPPWDGDLYVMFIVRPAFFDRVTRGIHGISTPVHRIEVQGGTVLEIHHMKDLPTIAATLRLRHDEDWLPKPK
jgi:hypothetical protein